MLAVMYPRLSQIAPKTAPSRFADWRDYIIYIGFVAIFLIFAATLGDKGFLDPNNLLNIIRQTAIIAIVAVSMTFVLSAAEIDLSMCGCSLDSGARVEGEDEHEGGHPIACTRRDRRPAANH